MQELILKLFGQGSSLNALQMGFRAFIMFFITLALIRLAGMRAFGLKSAFDAIIIILLGAILSRAVTGASPFFPVIVAGTVISLVHRALATLSVYNSAIGSIIKGDKSLLYKNGKLIEKNMRICAISEKDLLEELRINMSENSFEHVEEIYLERSGKISIIKKGKK